MKYWEKLKDPRWQQKRLKILERDGWQCQYCGDTSKTLHVHHGHYRAKTDPWDYDDESLHTLCEGCHKFGDELRKDLQEEVGKLPIRIQDNLMDFVLWLNCMYEDDINVVFSTQMPHLEDMAEIEVVVRGDFRG